MLLEIILLQVSNNEQRLYIFFFKVKNTKVRKRISFSERGRRSFSKEFRGKAPKNFFKIIDCLFDFSAFTQLSKSFKFTFFLVLIVTVAPHKKAQFFFLQYVC